MPEKEEYAYESRKEGCRDSNKLKADRERQKKEKTGVRWSEIITISVFVEQAEGFLELSNLLASELLSHGEEDRDKDTETQIWRWRRRLRWR